MKDIHGIRIYPQTVTEHNSGGVSLYTHVPLDDQKSEFECIFYPLWDYLDGKIVALDFYSMIGQDPLPELKEKYGNAIKRVDEENHVVFLDGSLVSLWAHSVLVSEFASLAVFKKCPEGSLTQSLFRSLHFKLSSANWPDSLLLAIHMWEDVYWQIFAPEGNVLNDMVKGLSVQGDCFEIYETNLENEYYSSSGNHRVSLSK